MSSLKSENKIIKIKEITFVELNELLKEGLEVLLINL